MSETEKEEQVIRIEVPPGQKERIRLDVYIASFVENATRTKVQAAIKEGRVLVNGRAGKASYVVQPSDVILCTVLKPKPVELIPQEIPLEVLYEDDSLLVVNKPAGMVVHPAYGHRDGTLVNALLHHVRTGQETEGSTLSNVSAGPRFEGDPTVRPGLVHRLDKDTSGVMVIAKDDVVHLKLARQFYRRSIDRVYQALLVGVVDASEGTIETRIGRDPRDRKRMAVVKEPAGKSAVTFFAVLERFTGATLVEFRLGTGRTHQIRVHAAHLGHPVLGDPVYGGRTVGAAGLTVEGRRLFEQAMKRLDRQALHARRLGFKHPVSGDWLAFEAPPPQDMLEVVALFRGGSGRAPAGVNS